MERAKVYTNVERAQEWLGLEPFDALGIGAVFWVLMIVNGNGLGWNILAVAGLWAGLRVLKRGRAPGFTTSLVRFYTRRPFFSAAAKDVEGAAHPFAPGARP